MSLLITFRAVVQAIFPKSPKRWAAVACCERNFIPDVGSESRREANNRLSITACASQELSVCTCHEVAYLSNLPVLHSLQMHKTVFFM